MATPKLWLLQNQCNMAIPKQNILKSMLFCSSIITSSILFVNYQFYWGQTIKKKRKIIFKTAKGLWAFFTNRLVHKQV